MNSWHPGLGGSIADGLWVVSSPKWKSRVGKHRCFRYLVSRRKFLLVLVIVFLCICLAVLKLKMQGNPAKVSSSDVCIATVEDDVGAGLHYSDFQESQSGSLPPWAASRGLPPGSPSGLCWRLRHKTHFFFSEIFICFRK